MPQFLTIFLDPTGSKSIFKIYEIFFFNLSRPGRKKRVFFGQNHSVFQRRPFRLKSTFSTRFYYVWKFHTCMFFNIFRPKNIKVRRLTNIKPQRGGRLGEEPKDLSLATLWLLKSRERKKRAFSIKNMTIFFIPTTWLRSTS